METAEHLLPTQATEATEASEAPQPDETTEPTEAPESLPPTEAAESIQPGGPGDNVEKLLALFRYIRELWALKYTVVTDLAQQPWRCFLTDIPNDGEHILVNDRDRVEEESEGSNILLEVKKPEFQPCPLPPSLLLAWLLPGWDQFGQKAPAHRDSLPTVDGDEPFDSQQVRTAAYENWLTKWKPWASRQRRLQTTRLFFTQLYQLYIDLKRESETLELMVGNGLLRMADQPEVAHPVLLKRVRLDFDPQQNRIRICDTDSDPELYPLLLQELNAIDYSAVKPLQEELLERDYHPLDRVDTPEFLRTLAHQLCGDSKYLDSPEQRPGLGDRLTVAWAPVYLVRRRLDGTLKAIEDTIAHIDASRYVPGHLLELVGGGFHQPQPETGEEPDIDRQLAALCGENEEILLAKEANREQLEVAERIRDHNAVLVQGPPGTGKTHTIANLLGHFLSQGQNVLVTSQTTKALSVLKSQVPAAIRDLCVSVLDDSNQDMIRSVDGITEYLSKYTSRKLAEKIIVSTQARSQLQEHLSALRRRIYSIKRRECACIAYDGVSYSPSQMAAFVGENRQALSYLPGAVPYGTPLPLSRQELEELYTSNVALTAEDEQELACQLPEPQRLAAPKDYAAFQVACQEAVGELKKAEQTLGWHLVCDFSGSRVLAEAAGESWTLLPQTAPDVLTRLASQAAACADLEGWMLAIAADGHRGGSYRRQWELLDSAILAAQSQAESGRLLTLGKTVFLPPDIPASVLDSGLRELEELLGRKSRLGRLDFLFKKSLEAVYETVTVNGAKLASAANCQAAQAALLLQERQQEAGRLWDQLMVPAGSPAFASLGPEPEEVCAQRIPALRRCLDWYEKEFTPLLEALCAAGIERERLFCYADLDPEATRIQKSLEALTQRLPAYCQAARAYGVLRAIREYEQKTTALLESDSCRDSRCCAGLLQTIRLRDAQSYDHFYQELNRLWPLYQLQERRAALLKKLKAAAPDWAAAIETRSGCHGSGVCPADVELAWQWQQFSAFLAELAAEPFDALQKQAVELARELREQTACLAAEKAWYHLLLRTEQNTDMRQALNGWKLTVTKIGKGTGKNAPLLRKQAREKMAKCQAAVPAWIMPINKALENLAAAESRFDVLIIDEASQSDVSALAVMYLARKVIIVGDDKQVSPMAVGVDVKRMNDLRSMYIKDAIPNWDLYDAKTSLYDLAKTTYQPLMLREHFRCVPQIIGYSNKLSYEGRIKPLRDPGGCLLVPAVASYRVEGRRLGRRKVNPAEAEALVALLCACLEQPEYAEKSFGVISLLGDDQAKLIQQYIFQHIEPATVEERRVLCGNASHFQGDERDVVFLSLVDSNEGDGPLKRSGEGADQSTKQRYNVAVSRAKDQLFIVHSLDYATDLKAGDMRRELLEYAEDPQAALNRTGEADSRAESPFEEAVGQALCDAGYAISRQWPVGGYRIDMVAQCGQKKIAIECDGEICHSSQEEIRRDMERQTILERVGWRFLRLRGSEYYLDPPAAIGRLCQALEEAGIKPGTPPVRPVGEALWERVKLRAAQLLAEWRSGQALSEQEPSPDGPALEESAAAPEEDAAPHKAGNRKK